MCSWREGNRTRRSAIDAVAYTVNATRRSRPSRIYTKLFGVDGRAPPQCVVIGRRSHTYQLFICYRCIVSRCAPYWANRQHGRNTGSARRSHGTGRRDGRRAQYTL